MLTTDTHGDYMAPWGGGHGIPLRDQEAQQEAGGGRGGEQTLLQTVDCGGLSCSSGPGPGRPNEGKEPGSGIELAFFRNALLPARSSGPAACPFSFHWRGIRTPLPARPLLAAHARSSSGWRGLLSAPRP